LGDPEKKKFCILSLQWCLKSLHLCWDAASAEAGLHALAADWVVGLGALSSSWVEVLASCGSETWVLGWVDVELEEASILDGDDMGAALEVELRWARGGIRSSWWASCWWCLGGDEGGEGQCDDGGEGLHGD